MRPIGLRRNGRFSLGSGLLLVSLAGIGNILDLPAASGAWLANQAPKAQTGGSLLKRAIEADPRLQTWPIRVIEEPGRKPLLYGRVPSRLVYDVAIGIALGSGIAFQNGLKIDTRLQPQVSLRAVPVAPAYPIGTSYLRPPGTAYFGIPSALFGPPIDPFAYEPPLIAYPPDFAQTTERRRQADRGLRLRAQNAPVAEPLGGGVDPSGETSLGSGPSVQVQYLGQGRIALRGQVASEQERVRLGETFVNLKGVEEVVNLLEVDAQVGLAEENRVPLPAQPGAVPRATAPAPAQDSTPAPANRIPGQRGGVEALDPPPEVDRGAVPAPPLPLPGRPQAEPPAPPGSGGQASTEISRSGASASPAIDPLVAQIESTFASRPALAQADLAVSRQGSQVLLSGEVPSIYEAMQAYLLASQVPGVAEVVDRISFAPPDPRRRNPLRDADPEDAIAYLTYQVERNLGDLAEVASLTIRGDTLHLNLVSSDPRLASRITATLRTTAVLRGWQLMTEIR